MRTFNDLEGRSWRVWHVMPQSDVLRGSAPHLASGWLCFERDGEKRRLVEPPERWESESEQGLAELLARALPVKLV